MELNMKDILNAAAAATSEFVKNLYGVECIDENESAVTFETTITLLDKDSTPVSVIRSTKTNLEQTEEVCAEEPEKAEVEEEIQAAEKEAPAAFQQPAFPGYFGFPYGAMPVPDPNAAPMPGAYYGMPFPYPGSVPVSVPTPQQSAPVQAQPAPEAKPVEKKVAESDHKPVEKAPEKKETEADASTTNQLGVVQLPLNRVRDAVPNEDRDRVDSMPAEKDDSDNDEPISRAEKIDMLLKKYSNI